ncbi:ribonuclease M5 [Lapidilactobacillus luobeiensis]|uniref:ribonuclease M5 n=1 Tax=Lapidilactobacillus luobeiensis TaxID=2950371 RepID=UPI0021C4BAFF|nr:ribonuclease M5 [Lapidilactobacillus luobeiensis]
MIQEVIVVEGRDDTRRLREVFGAVDTIETRGSAVPDQILKEIQAIAQKRPLIILTDPDFNGEQIRQKVLAVVPTAKQAFLPRSQARPNGKGSLGVEHASAADLRACLQHVLTTSTTYQSALTHLDLVQAGLVAGPNAKKRRERLGDLLHIGYTNGKQLLPRLQMLQISGAEFKQALRRLEEDK